jgi:hypothetical protein
MECSYWNWGGVGRWEMDYVGVRLKRENFQEK